MSVAGDQRLHHADDHKAKYELQKDTGAGLCVQTVKNAVPLCALLPLKATGLTQSTNMLRCTGALLK